MKRLALFVAIGCLIAGSVAAQGQQQPPYNVIDVNHLPVPNGGSQGSTSLAQGDYVVIARNGITFKVKNGTGGTGAQTCSANQWVSGLTAIGVISCTQPSFANISGTLQPSQVPSSVLAIGTSTANASPFVAGDTTTGLYTPGPAQVGIAIGSTAALNIGTQGMILGAPTGGYKGAGTLNAINLYINGTAVTGGGSGITTLTGDVVATGTGSVAATVARINGATLGTTTATSGNILIGNGTSWNSSAMSGDATMASGGVLTLGTTGVTAASYTCLNGTVDAKGRLTTASNGSCGGSGTITSSVATQVPVYTAATTIAGNSAFTYASGVVGIGTSGTIGNLKLFGNTSGSLTIAPQATAGTPLWTAGTSSGTPVVTASSPLAITTATGNVTCATCATTTSGGGLTATTPMAISAGGIISIANAAADGSTLGAAAFNATNFSASAGVVNTIQNINTTATPQFAALGLGTTAPTTSKLGVSGSISVGTQYGGANIAAPTNGAIIQGNVGLGTTSVASNDVFDIAMGSAGSVRLINQGSNTGDAYLQSVGANVLYLVNGYYNGTNFVYGHAATSSSPAAMLQLQGGAGNGNIYFAVGAAGTAGNTISWTYPMGISSAANVCIGCSTSAATNKLDVRNNMSIGYTATSAPTNGLIVGGNVGLGTSSNISGAGTTISNHIGYSPVNVPTISTCGGGTLATGSTDNKGQITGITAATACTITFSSALPAGPSCQFSSNNAITPTGVPTTSAVTTSMTALTGTMTYICQ